jgi:Septum formation initiator
MLRRAMTNSKLIRLEARVRVIRGAGRVMFLVLCVAVGFVAVATAIPQRRALEKLEAKLQLAKANEVTVMADREYHQVELRALKEDPAFLEIHARDRLDYYREGERVLKFKDAR